MKNPLMKKITKMEYKPSDTYEDRRKIHEAIVAEQNAKKQSMQALNFQPDQSNQ